MLFEVRENFYRCQDSFLDRTALNFIRPCLGKIFDDLSEQRCVMSLIHIDCSEESPMPFISSGNSILMGFIYCDARKELDVFNLFES
jgi:hypothetical protein